MWNELKSNDDIELFMKKYGNFHDSCIREFNYVSGAYVNKDCSMFPINSKKELSIIFQRQCKDIMNIQLVFCGLKSLNFVPSIPNFEAIISKVCMKIIGDDLYWCVDCGFNLACTKDLWFNSNYTWLCCEWAKWRTIDID